MSESHNDRLRAYIEAAILDHAPTWESLFDSGPGQVVGVRDAAIVAAMAASRFRLLHDADPSHQPLRLNKPRTQADDDRVAGRKWRRA